MKKLILILVMTLYISGCVNRINFPLVVQEKRTKEGKTGCILILSDGANQYETFYDLKFCNYEIGQEVK